MDIKYTRGHKDLDWERLSMIYSKTGFGFKSAKRLEEVFINSQYVVFASYNDELVGALRAFSDGSDCAVVCDMAVLPDLQGNGIGSHLLKNLLDDIGNRYHRIMLYATLGKEHFYSKHGFGLMTSAMCIFRNQQKAIKSGYIRK